MARGKKNDSLSYGYFESYAEYNRILRSWFVAFGIGGLALFVVEDKLRDLLIASGETRKVASLLLAGAAAQVTVAFLNKYANWYCYFAEDNAAFQRSRFYAFWSWVTRQFWIDIVLDLLTTGCFLAAIWILFAVIAR
jgi:hypothetical protein